MANASSTKLPVPAALTETLQYSATSLDRSREQGGGPCGECRLARCKCSEERPTCGRCLQLGLICSDEPRLDLPSLSAVSFDVRPGSTETASPAADTRPRNRHEDSLTHTRLCRGHCDRESGDCDIEDKRLVHAHIDAFYTFVYPSHGNSFIHRATLLREIAQRRVSRKLLLALCCLSNRFLPTPSPSDPCTSGRDDNRASKWAREARALCVQDAEISIDTVTVALLLAKYDVYQARYASAWMICSIANRAALALGLHKEVNGTMGFVERETRRRLLWGCYCMDRMMSTGIPDHIMIQPRSIQIQLPCEDHQYLLGIPSTTPIPILETAGVEGGISQGSVEEQSIGIFGHYVRMTGMRYEILRYRRDQDNLQEVLFPPWHPRSSFSDCAHKLTAWYQGLPAQFQLTPDTMYARQSRNQLSALVMLHVWYDQCMSDLTRIALPGFPETASAALLSSAPEGWVRDTQRACVDHARRIGKTLKLVGDHVDRETFQILDASLPICVYESMRVQVQWLFMQQETINIDTLKEEIKAMLSWIKDMGSNFKQAERLLRESNKTLYRHGLAVADPGSTGEKSRAQSPLHPWSLRERELRIGDPEEPAIQPLDLYHPPGPELGFITSGAEGGSGDLPSSYPASAPAQEDIDAMLRELTQFEMGSDEGVPAVWDMWMAAGFDETLFGTNDSFQS